MNKITGTIITLNNEKIIEDCIISLKSLCDEIIVVDSLSKDQTVKIAKDLGAKVHLQEFLGDGPQNHLRVSQGLCDLLLSSLGNMCCMQDPV